MLEFGGLAGIGEGYVGDEAPRFEFCRVRGLTGIVLGQALFQICRDADVAPALAARTYQQIDVMHSRRVGTPIASGVRIFRPLNEGDSENYAALLRASEGTLGGGDGLFRQAAPLLAKCDAPIPLPPVLPLVHRFSTTEMDHLVS